jgi:hypothetical protein
MGVSIETWRSRIGQFHGYSFKSNTNNLDNINNNSKGMNISYLPIFVIAMLLIVGGIEPNPGPTVEELVIQCQKQI